MRWGLLIGVLLAGAFSMQWGARIFYMHKYEFSPALQEWDDAHARGDRLAMTIALEKMKAVHAASGPFWFLELLKSEECRNTPAVVPYRDGMTLCPGQSAIGEIFIVPIEPEPPPANNSPI
jgi:hypothetical protein